ncbi:MAG: hypothetical protein ACYC5X_09260 [Syntrophales bacterium]
MQFVKTFDILHRILTRDSFAGLEKWSALAGDAAMDPTLIFGGSEAYQHKGVRVLGWQKSGELLADT